MAPTVDTYSTLSVGVPARFYSVNNSLSAPTSYYWYASPGGSASYVSTPVSNYVAITFYESIYYQVVSEVTNACGTGAGYRGVSVTRGGSPSIVNFYPNPVSDILNVEIDPPANLKAPPTYDIRLYDGQGNILRQQKAQGGTVQFNVSALPDGIYYLHIYDGVSETPEMHQIMVEH